MLKSNKKTENIRELNEYLHQLKALRYGDYLSIVFYEILMKFIAQKESCILNFLQDSISATQICQKFISYMIKSKTTYSYDKLLESLLPVEYELDVAIRRNISKPFCTKTVNLFGFGLSNGYYEKSIAAYLVAEKYCEQVRIFGFDPYVCSKDKDITYLMPEDVASCNVPKFDIFISRWVLHHVRADKRWGDLSSFLNHINSNGDIFIVEEGPSLTKTRSTHMNIYTLEQILEDAFVNYVLSPKWCCSPDYHIEYLDEEDFTDIEKSLVFKYRKNKMILNEGSLAQAIIHYGVE